jgi:hypothetical protein
MSLQPAGFQQGAIGPKPLSYQVFVDPGRIQQLLNRGNVAQLFLAFFRRRNHFVSAHSLLPEKACGAQPPSAAGLGQQFPMGTGGCKLLKHKGQWPKAGFFLGFSG